MAENPFIDKFKSKSDHDLIKVAEDSKSYVLQARLAALQLLKERDYDSIRLEKADKDLQDLVGIEKEQDDSVQEQDRRIIRNLKQIEIGQSITKQLASGYEVEITRINEDSFKMVKDYLFQGKIGPLIMCKIKDDQTYLCYPSLYLRPMWTIGLGGTALIALAVFFGNMYYERFVFLIPLIAAILPQLVLMPFQYYISQDNLIEIMDQA